MAISATAVGRIQTDGSDSNGGFFDPGVSSPGTDYSGQASAQVTYTDLVIGAGALSVTSVANPFTSAHVGNAIRITGGTGFTVGTYMVTGVAAGVATVDRTIGTAASTGGTGNLGGYLLSPGMVGSIMSSLTAGYTVNVKAGTYNMSNTSNVSGGKLNISVAGQWYGFTTTPGDITLATLWGTLPSCKANANSVSCITISSNDVTLAHIECDGNNGSFSGTACFNGGGLRYRAFNCRGKNSGSGTNGCFNSTNGGVLIFCEAISGANSGFFVPSAFGCLSRSNTGNGFQPSATASQYIGCVSYLNGGDGFTSSSPMNAYQCASVSNTGAGFQVDAQSSVINSIAYNNGTYGFATTASALQAFILNCATGANTSGAFNSTQIPSGNKVGNVTLSGDPFTSKSTLDFSLNNTAGAGASCRNAGIGTYPGSATTGYPDIGAARHQDSGGGTVSPVDISCPVIIVPMRTSGYF